MTRGIYRNIIAFQFPVGPLEEGSAETENEKPD